MFSPDSTCWTVLRAAAAGANEARGAFAGRYEPMVRAYLAARWRGSPLMQELDDAVQEAFVECLRQGGGLERATFAASGTILVRADRAATRLS